MKQIFWNSGLNNFKQNELVIGDQSCDYTIKLNEEEFLPNRSIHDIFYDHLLSRQTKTVELLYSGGADSELILKSCIKNNIPVLVYTLKFRAKGLLLNIRDAYYSEKFCRENNIKQKIFELDAIDFFESGKYLEYLDPYYITEPHVATHFWLIEQCSKFPIVGGDWPWVQSKKNVLSPFKLAFNSYERFMKDKGITGIGNMLSHSYESSYFFMQKQCQYSEYDYFVPLLKQKMYDMDEPRFRSYGWESVNPILFDINVYKNNLLGKYKTPNSKIIWGEKTKKLINSVDYENEKFF